MKTLNTFGGVTFYQKPILLKDVRRAVDKVARTFPVRQSVELERSSPAKPGESLDDPPGGTEGPGIKAGDVSARKDGSP